MKRLSTYLIFTFLLFFPFVLRSDPAYQVIPDKATLPLLNPSLHEQKIEKIQLANGLQAVLVSDPTVKQSAVTISVMAGSWQEPDEFHGLAHFLEHMLFLGTSEYPEESSFTKFLTAHGGQTNAFTHGDYTSYMFALNNDGFAEGIKRFASFFKTPLFNPSGVSRELNAIDQEFAQGFNNEDVRGYHVIKHLASPLHPFSRFQTGNSQTLAKATTADLKKWFESKYSANLMRLYVLSSEPIDEIRKQVIEDFSGIPNRNLKPFQHRNGLFTNDTLGHLVRIAPKNATQSLTLVWEVPSSIPPMLDSRPADVLCAILGYEGKNSLLSNLRKEGLADSLSCGAMDVASLTYLFEIDIKLTSKGISDVDTVIERVFQTLHMIHQNKIPDYIFEDIAEMLKQRYQFQQRDEPFEWAMNQASTLATEPIETFPELTKTLHSFNQDAINLLLTSLTPQNSIFILTAPSSTLKKQEPWMQIAYDIEPIPEIKLQNWSKAPPLDSIALPPKNPFLAHSPTATKVLIDKNVYPEIPAPALILNTSGGKIYYSQDPFYQVPRTALVIQIQSPEVKDGRPQSIVMAEIYVKALKDSLRDIIDEAQMADLQVSIERGLGCIQITLEGFTESLISFSPDMISKISPLQLSAEQFDLIKDSLSIEYENTIATSPIKQSFERFKNIVFERFTTVYQKMNVISKITFQNFQAFQTNLFKQTFIKGAFVGSLLEAEAKTLASSLDKALHSNLGQEASPYYAQVKELDNDNGPISYNYTTHAEGSALLLVIEMEKFSPQSRNIQDLLSQTMSEAFFAELRTRQQTGYIVLSDSMDLQKHLFSFFGVQSTTHTPNELLWRFELFIETYLNELAASNIPKERFELLKTSLASQLKTPPANLKLYGERMFKLAFDIEDFGWFAKRLDDLKILTYEEFIQTSKEFLSRNNRRRVAINIVGKNKNNAPFEYKSFSQPKQPIRLTK